MTKFETWWHDVGSGILPQWYEDLESFAKLVAQESWKHSRMELLDELADETIRLSLNNTECTKPAHYDRAIADIQVYMLGEVQKLLKP